MRNIKNLPTLEEWKREYLGEWDMEEEISNEPEADEPHECHCDMQVLLSVGCKCGGV